LIFDGGATIAGIKAGSAAYDSAFFSLRSVIDNIVSQVISQFYQVVLNRALIVAQEQNVALLQQQVKDQQAESGTLLSPKPVRSPMLCLLSWRRMPHLHLQLVRLRHGLSEGHRQVPFNVQTLV
jgi:hypothetical protein